MKLLIQTEIEAEDVAFNNDHEAIREFILQLDLLAADVDFTEELVKKLMSSIRKDLGEVDYLKLVNSLK